jgi:hypothetical protein
MTRAAPHPNEDHGGALLAGRRGRGSRRSLSAKTQDIGKSERREAAETDAEKFAA